jgi:hypothetical protein
MTIKLTKDRSAVVDTAIKWLPVGTVPQPIGARCLTINRRHGSTRLDIWSPKSDATHWHPLPTFLTEEDDA